MRAADRLVAPHFPAAHRPAESSDGTCLIPPFPAAGHQSDTPVLPTVPTRHEKVVHQPLASDEVVLLHLESGAYHELNPVGALIWDLIDGERTVPQIVEEVRRRVDQPPEDVDSEVESFLGDLHRRDLIT